MRRIRRGEKRIKFIKEGCTDVRISWIIGYLARHIQWMSDPLVARLVNILLLWLVMIQIKLK